MKRSGPLRRNKPINRRSKKTAKKYKDQRVPLVKRLLAERPNCQACEILHKNTWGRKGSIPPRRSVDLHEILSRARGGDILDEDNILCVCRDCHSFLTENGKFAESLGLAAPGWVKTSKKIFKRSDNE